jgi:hypothetical protein
MKATTLRRLVVVPASVALAALAVPIVTVIATHYA